MPEMKSENGSVENMKSNSKLWKEYVESEDEKQLYKSTQKLLPLYPQSLF